MKYEVYAREVLKRLGVYKRYKGCEYIVSCINYIQENEKDFLPMTKILYVDIAKKHNTSGRCIERDMRNVIANMWKQKKSEELMSEIFGECNLYKRPTNMEFLMLLYNYIKYRMKSPIQLDSDKYNFTCPLSGDECEYCNEFIENVLNDIHI